MPGSVSRTVDVPETRTALAGNAPAAPPVRTVGPGLCPDLLERVQLAVIVLDGVHVIAGPAGHEGDRDDPQDDDDRDKTPDQHRLLFNRIEGAGYTATLSGLPKSWEQKAEATAAGGSGGQSGPMSSGISARSGLP